MIPASSASMLWTDALLVALMVGLALALVVGELLLARPQALFALNARMSRWVDTRAAFGLLDRPHHLERFFYRHHWPIGILIALGAGYVLWRWAFAYERSEVLALLSRRWLASGLDWVPAALEATVVALHGAILVVGLLVAFRPSLLKEFERAANHWQRGPATAPFDTVIGTLDGTFEGSSRVSGLLLTIAACWCLLALAPFLAGVLAR